MIARLVLLAPLALAACDAPDRQAPEPAANEAAPIAAKNAAQPSAAERPSGQWDLLSSGEGDGLHFTDAAGETRALLFCEAGGNTILVNVRGFDPVASEERMTFGAGGDVVTLVAGPTGDPLRGGVSGAGPVPAALPAILADPEGIGVNYGYQNIGPLPPVPADRARAFAGACAD